MESVIIISIVRFFLELTAKKKIKLFEFLKSLILNPLILSIFIPILFYYFINFSIRYNEVYLIIGVIFLISIFSDKYVKDR